MLLNDVKPWYKGSPMRASSPKSENNLLSKTKLKQNKFQVNKVKINKKIADNQKPEEMQHK
jgi:hypothetical protein